MKNQLLYILSFSIISLVFSSENIVPHLESSKSANSRSNSVHIVAIMVEFSSDNDPKTTGDGKFLTGYSDEYIYYYCDDSGNCGNNSESQNPEKRCEGFLVDPPPHDSLYFVDQIKAVKNYYTNVSKNQIEFDYHVIGSIYQLDKTMAEYSEISSYTNSNETIAQLFADGVELAKDDIQLYVNGDESIYLDDIIIVMFHAGVGEDYGFEGYFDPANYDIRSAYIDDDIASYFPDSSWLIQKDIKKGILLPETLNIIYYNTIEDIYGYLGQGMCNMQMGMVGLFSYLLGYEFGLPEMFDRNTGTTGLGVFELMDIGSFNANGVIPAPPQAWSRMQMGWEESELLFDESDDGYEINKSRFDNEGFNPSVHRIDMSHSEYYLIETIDNKMIREFGDERINFGIPEITYLSTMFIFPSDTIIIPESEISLFDRLLYLDQSIDELINQDSEECDPNSRITISPETGVVLCVSNYDYGMPGDGMLIWHINETNINNLNDDPNNRTVKLIEADGAQDIGYFNYFYPWENPTIGWERDIWYNKNPDYFFVNAEEDTEEGLRFNASTTPSSHTDNGSRSLVEIKNIQSAETSSMKFKVKFNDDIFQQEFVSDLGDITLICVGGIYNDYYVMSEGSVMIFDTGSELLSSDLISYNYQDIFNYQDIPYESGNFVKWTMGNDLFSYPSDYYLDGSELLPLYGYTARGYFNSYNTLDFIPEEFRGIAFLDLAIGDIDQDGLDEIIERTDDYINCFNGNGTICNGFPVIGSFDSNILIGEITGDDYPEIIVRGNENINIISYDGEIDYRIASEFSSDLYLRCNREYDNEINMIVDGNRYLYMLESNNCSGYWTNPNGTFNNRPDVNPYSQHNSSDNIISSGISVFYNYPNPTKNGNTAFRYFVSDVDKVEIKIYSPSGFLIKTIKDMSFIENEYNEVIWDVKDKTNGLFLANLITYRSGKQSDSRFTKILVSN